LRLQKDKELRLKFLSLAKGIEQATCANESSRALVGCLQFCGLPTRQPFAWRAMHLKPHIHGIKCWLLVIFYHSLCLKLSQPMRGLWRVLPVGEFVPTPCLSQPLPLDSSSLCLLTGYSLVDLLKPSTDPTKQSNPETSCGSIMLEIR
jgi:hypothetical protein